MTEKAIDLIHNNYPWCEERLTAFLQSHRGAQGTSEQFFEDLSELYIAGGKYGALLILAVCEAFPSRIGSPDIFYTWLDGHQNTSLVLRSVADEAEAEAEWLIPGYIPRGELFLLAGDGGSGKTSIWCSIVADLTQGRPTIFEKAIGVPDDFQRSSMSVMYISSEDSTAYVLKRKLRLYNANQEAVFFLPLTDPHFGDLKFGSSDLEKLIRTYRPALCIFDPVQSFIPKNCEMSSRSQMRDALNSLLQMGEKYRTTFGIVVHSNKKSGVSARKRISDSSDLWDIARSVLIVGQTSEDGVFYCSHEKSNYGALQPTILYTLEDGVCHFSGTTMKRDADYVSEVTATRSAPAKDVARDKIIEFLGDGEKPSKELDVFLRSCGVSTVTAKRVKSELKTAGRIKYRCEKRNGETVWFTVSCPA